LWEAAQNWSVCADLWAQDHHDVEVMDEAGTVQARRRLDLLRYHCGIWWLGLLPNSRVLARVRRRKSVLFPKQLDHVDHVIVLG
jgi:hypothetical protein